VEFDEVAATIKREPAAVRQLVSRARAHVRADRPRFPLEKEQGLEIANAFFAASRNGDMQKLQSLLASDVVVYADGGGKKPAAAAPIVGLEQVMKLHVQLARVFAKTPSQVRRFGLVNGLPGFVTLENGDTLQTTALQIETGKVIAIYVVRNPDKLRHLGDSTVH
jgi:RNA polymerase sigma-70 factor, ECF subfamily